MWVSTGTMTVPCNIFSPPLLRPFVSRGGTERVPVIFSTLFYGELQQQNPGNGVLKHALRCFFVLCVYIFFFLFFFVIKPFVVQLRIYIIREVRWVFVYCQALEGRRQQQHNNTRTTLWLANWLYYPIMPLSVCLSVYCSFSCYHATVNTNIRGYKLVPHWWAPCFP